MGEHLNTIVMVLGIISGGGLLGLATMIYRFGSLQTSQNKDIEDLKSKHIELKVQVDKVCDTERPMEVCKVKIERAVEKAEDANCKVSKQTAHNIETENKVSELKGQVTEGFAQMTKGMEIVQNAFMSQVG